MKLNKEDIIKYWELKEHQRDDALNIGIIGNKRYFKRKVKSLIGRFRHYDFMYANKELTRYTIINNKMETTYILLENLEDLSNIYFKKYLI